MRTPNATEIALFRDISRKLHTPLFMLMVVPALAACEERGTAPGPRTRLTSQSLTGCGKVTFQGCCLGQAVWFCKSNKLQKLSCAKNPTCGWSSTYNLYDCGTAGKADPAGKNPLSCAAAFGDGGPPTDGPATDGPTADGPQVDGPALEVGLLKDAWPGDKAALVDVTPSPDSGGCGAMTHEGCCDGNSLWYCDSGKVKTINCGNNPTCGWDAKASVYDCGTAGTADPTNKHAMPCTSLGDGGVAATDGQGPDATSGGDAGLGCGELTIEGCCDGHTLWYCSAGKARHYSCAGKPQCGWNPLAKWYLCKTTGGADPGGKFPRSCKGLLWDGGPPSTDTGPPEMGPDQALPDLRPPDSSFTQDITEAAVDGTPADTAAEAARPDSGPKDEDDGEGSCGCAVDSRAGPGPWTLVMLAALVVIARRRTRRGRS